METTSAADYVMIIHCFLDYSMGMQNRPTSDNWSRLCEEFMFHFGQINDDDNSDDDDDDENWLPSKA